jgi:hypothetical protein
MFFEPCQLHIGAAAKPGFLGGYEMNGQDREK